MISNKKEDILLNNKYNLLRKNEWNNNYKRC